MSDKIFYEETPLGVDFSKMWSKEAIEALEAAGEAIARFKGPALGIKDLIDNPDLDQHQTEVSVAYILGVSLGAGVLKPIQKIDLDEFIRDLFEGRRD